MTTLHPIGQMRLLWQGSWSGGSEGHQASGPTCKAVLPHPFFRQVFLCMEAVAMGIIDETLLLSSVWLPFLLLSFHRILEILRSHQAEWVGRSLTRSYQRAQLGMPALWLWVSSWTSSSLRYPYGNTWHWGSWGRFHESHRGTPAPQSCFLITKGSLLFPP